MSPFPLSGGGATGAVTVTCTSNSSPCVAWTIDSNAAPLNPNANVANLYRYSSTKNTGTWIYIGQYYNSFRIGLTKP